MGGLDQPVCIQLQNNNWPPLNRFCNLSVNKIHSLFPTLTHNYYIIVPLIILGQQPYEFSDRCGPWFVKWQTKGGRSCMIISRYYFKSIISIWKFGGKRILGIQSFSSLSPILLLVIRYCMSISIVLLVFYSVCSVWETCLIREEDCLKYWSKLTDLWWLHCGREIRVELNPTALTTANIIGYHINELFSTRITSGL